MTDPIGSIKILVKMKNVAEAKRLIENAAKEGDRAELIQFCIPSNQPVSSSERSPKATRLEGGTPNGVLPQEPEPTRTERESWTRDKSATKESREVKKNNCMRYDRH